jgi:hypothetical protein
MNIAKGWLMSLVVNLYAGPGAGKTTTALRLTSDLKLRGLNVEYVSEYVKDAAWWGHLDVFDQPDLCFAGQHRALRTVHAKCDVVVCDSPINLPIVYATSLAGYPHAEFSALVHKLFSSYDNLNLLIDRGQLPYEPIGRNQTYHEALAVDSAVDTFLGDNDIPRIKFDPKNDTQYQTVLRYITKQQISRKKGL